MRRRRAWRDLVQAYIEPVFETERHHGAGHAVQQSGPACRRPGTADRPSVDSDHDGEALRSNVSLSILESSSWTAKPRSA